MAEQQTREQESAWVYVGDLDQSPMAGRLHAQVQGRYVTVIRLTDDDGRSKLYCLDSVCFHAGGPLALGDIEELPTGELCLKCPWHFYCVAVKTGEKYYQGTVQGPDGKLLPGPWKSVGPRQRTHRVEQRPDGVYVQLNLAGSLASDEYAYKHECGLRIQTGHLRLSPQHLHASNGMERSRSPRMGSSRAGSPSARHASPRSSPPASPRYSGEGEDCWPEDLPAPPPHHGRHSLTNGTQL